MHHECHVEYDTTHRDAFVDDDVLYTTLLYERVTTSAASIRSRQLYTKALDDRHAFCI